MECTSSTIPWVISFVMHHSHTILTINPLSLINTSLTPSDFKFARSQNDHLRVLNCAFPDFAALRLSERRDCLLFVPSVSGEKVLKPKTAPFLQTQQIGMTNLLLVIPILCRLKSGMVVHQPNHSYTMLYMFIPC